MKPITITIIGAGLRGIRYGEYAHTRPQEMKVIAVAEPDDFKRSRAQEAFNLREEKCFTSWDELFAAGKQSDAVFICTRDRDHYAPAIKALEAGYHVMLEKPMSPSWAECIELERIAEKHNRILTICHVLRYAPFFQTIKQLLDGGRIGRLMSIQHNENVGYWHQAHSYVRGYFNSAEKSSPMILAKSCHDLDILLWLAGADCTRVSSFGGDWGLMRDFLRLVQADGGQQGLTSADRSVQSHMIAFAAEQSRVAGKTLELAEFVRGLRSCSAG